MFVPGFGPLERPREWTLKLDGALGLVNPPRDSQKGI